MEKLGIDIRLLGFQIFNFLLIILLLNKLIFKPLSKKMEERKKLIEKGLAKEGEVEEKLLDIEAQKEKIITAAQREMDQMMADTIKKAEVLRADILEKARKESDALIKRTRDLLAGEREEMLSQAKEELVEITIESLKTILGDQDQNNIKEKLNKKAIQKLWQKDKIPS